MKRREFITLIGGATAWPLAARAQQADPMRRIAWLMSFAESDPLAPPRVAAFERALQQFGWTAGRNIRIEYRWTASNPEFMRRFAKELAVLNPDVLLTNAGPLLRELARETETVPIVFVIASHPVEYGEAKTISQSRKRALCRGSCAEALVNGGACRGDRRKRSDHPGPTEINDFAKVGLLLRSDSKMRVSRFGGGSPRNYLPNLLQAYTFLFCG